MVENASLPQHVRVSSGSAVILGLLDAKLDAVPTTVYLMTYRPGRCAANCSFCPQAKGSQSRADMLSRVSWPMHPTNMIIGRIEKTCSEGTVKRVCIQALNYSEVFRDLVALVDSIHTRAKVPISVSCQPLERKNISDLAVVGTERIGIPLDAATKEIFTKIKGSSVGGPYSWERQLQMLEEAVKIFGRGKVSTHFIVGLGETEKQLTAIMQECVDMTVLPALFAFTPIPGTALAASSQPNIGKYRRLQLARHLIVRGFSRYEGMVFDEIDQIADFGVEKQTLIQLVRTGDPFLTSGCPDCNRPYYNEKPSGPFYNFPRKLTRDECLEVEEQLRLS